MPLAASVRLRYTARSACRVLVLDRPNPLGLMHISPHAQPGQRVRGVEGNLLRPGDANSFVGWLPLPFRHGLVTTTN
eukprot:g30572.t1